jgi:hypothetical protein
MVWWPTSVPSMRIWTHSRKSLRFAEWCFDWLRFVPHTDGEEVLLDNLIESLVKDRLATVDAQPTASGHYVYQLWPDWPAIMSHLRHSSMPQELRCWLETQA